MALRTAADFTAENPTLPVGVTMMETDTGRTKTGDGATKWNSLSYNTAPTASNSSTLAGTTPTTVGLTLLSAADAPAQRTALGLGTLATQSATCSGTNTGDQSSVTGNAGTATALQTARTINGTSFDGTANITITAAAGTLTGTSLASGVTGSSLTSFGASPTLTTPNIGVANGTSLTATGAIVSSGTAGIGYTGGAGGTVTQITSKSTGVTLNKLCGLITLNSAALASAAIVTFTVTNSTTAANDVIFTQHDSGGTVGAYTITANTPAAGSFKITVRNNTAGSLSEAIVIRYATIKAVIA